ncbi:YceI family protein [uncultured Algimonas sp.]|uniref:YceI family protein n=1 Tax=uncultured Algimonas sp. TaxID=1547920 RepID=UPI00262F33D9|nr:YceI family protein [uncultured Algimonas sp.]
MKKLLLPAILAIALSAGAQAQTPDDAAAPETFDFSTIPAGTYTDDNGHAYIQFSYDHQGYSRPILRWSEFDATVEFDPENLEESTLNVVIPVDSIDSMVLDFDDHLKSDDFFDVETYPEITFRSTSLDIAPDGTGTITGDLTIKDITRPITFDGRINKAGKHFMNGKDMFGISGTGTLLRSDYGVGKYAPNVGDEVELVMEVEFQKADE